MHIAGSDRVRVPACAVDREGGQEQGEGIFRGLDHREGGI